MSQQRRIEVRVGILILVALGLLAGFIVVMGGLTFEPTYRVNVDFTNPGALKTGAPVRLSGVRVGKVSNIEFRGDDPTAVEHGTLIRVVAELQNQYQNTIHTDARWFISTQGVLGEQFLAVEPGTTEAGVLPDGAEVVGISPPRLDLLLSEAYELLHFAYVGVLRNEKKLAETFDGLHRTLVGSGRFFERNQGKIDDLVDNLQTLSTNANSFVDAARAKYVDNAQIDRMLRNLDATTGSVRRDLPPLLQRSRGLVAELNRVSAALGSDAQLKRYDGITKDVEEITTRGQKIASDLESLVTTVKAGKGTAGALLQDETLYDDLQEFMREVKHNPWKIFWRE